MFNKKYTMKDNYNVDDLIVGNLEYISSRVTTEGIKDIKTSQKYLFEKVNDNGKTKYREIFTGFIADSKESGCFDVPWIVNLEPLNECFQGKDVLPRYALLLVLDIVNPRKELSLDKINSEQKVKKNKKR